SADLLEKLAIDSQTNGVRKTTGICEKRAISNDEQGNAIYSDTPNPDKAWRLSDSLLLNIETRDVFHTSFPHDFSILVTFKAEYVKYFNLISIYSREGVVQLSFTISDNITFSWRDNSETTASTRNSLLTATFTSRIKDNEWHRLAVSCKGDSITLLTDCNTQQTKPFLRRKDSSLDLSGVTFVGQSTNATKNFDGIIQQLFVIPTSEAAYEQCVDYIPDCESPFPYEDVIFTEPTTFYDNANSETKPSTEEISETFTKNTTTVITSSTDNYNFTEIPVFPDVRFI
ncbi:collagen alpha-1(XI) chain-like protein, partial [Leptotrombidium deliense]